VRRSSGVGFWYCDLPFNTLEWDEQVKRHFWLAPDDVVTIDTFFERLHPDDREPTRLAIERAISTRTAFDTTYRTVEPGTGVERWIRAIGRTGYDCAGVATHFDGVSVDVTEQKRAEAALREQDRRKDEFIATLAHELRNPLAPIRTGIQVMKLSHATDDAAARSLDMMDRQLSHMVRLIDDLLDVSRIRRGKVELKRERVEVRTIIAHFTVEIAPEPMWVDGDLTRLAQVVSNLLNNAAKFTPNGSGRITLSAAAEGEHAVIRICDNGVGIATDELPKVFDLGIGLSLAKKLVDLHGATIAAESAGVGQGSTFTVSHPARRRRGG
jgi:PAS domain S-box-containing protein